MKCWLATCACALVLCVGPSLAMADHHNEPDQLVGDSIGALPGVARVGFAGPLEKGVSLSAFSGYGFTGEVLNDGDSHHQVSGEIAASLRLTEYFGFGIQLDGRYDKHNGSESDDGWVGNPRINARAANRIGDTPFAAGGQLRLWLPGADAPSVRFEAATVDLIALGSYAPVGSPLTVSVNAGFRLDNSAESVDDPMSLSAADRLALGVSDSNALLLGLGVTYATGDAEILGEWSWDLLVGGDAPDTGESPMRVSAGIRYKVSDTLAAQAIADIRVSSTPTLDPMGATLFPVDPTFRGMIGLHYRFPTDRPKVEERLTDKHKVEPPPPAPAQARGKVTSAGQPVAGAKVTITIVGGNKPFETTSGDDGGWSIEGLPKGAGQITVEKDGYQKGSAAVQLVPGQIGEVSVILDRELPPGQLRGTVRSYKGAGVKATLTILPMNKSSSTDDKGEFQIDLPPGDYEVVIEAPGFSNQRRQVKIEEDSVTILNVDLPK